MSALFERWTGLALLDPGLLLLALLVPVALWIAGRRGGPALSFAPLSLFGGSHALPGSWRTRLLFLPRALTALGLLLLVVAIARPAARERLPLEAEGIDILLCLDTSSSMTANDMDLATRRTRLALARDAAVRFVRGREHDRIGLLTFARYPDVRCPLTLDHDALESILQDVRAVRGEGPEDATGIGTAVARAAQVLDGSSAASKVVVLLTDGDENVAQAGAEGEIAPAHAAQLCERLGVRVYAIVAGTGRPDPGGTWSKPDPQAVREIATRTGGAFLEAEDAGALDRVYGQIDALERTFFEEPRTVVRDRYLPFLAAALALVFLGALLAASVLEVQP